MLFHLQKTTNFDTYSALEPHILSAKNKAGSGAKPFLERFYRSTAYIGGRPIEGKNRNHGVKKGQAKVALTPILPILEAQKISFAFPHSGNSQGLLVLNYIGLKKISLAAQDQLCLCFSQPQHPAEGIAV